MKQLIKRSATLLCLLLCLSAISIPAMAYPAVDLQQETSLTLQYGPENNPIPDAYFELFRVADVSQWLHYTLSGDFRDDPVELNGLDSAGWRAAAETLAAYAQRYDRDPLRSGKTDDQGRLTFSDLTVGLYLVVGNKTIIGNRIYTPEPQLILLPGMDQKDQWVYDLTAKVKYDEDKIHDRDTVDRKVLKIWEDDGSHPKEIVVQLLRNDKVYDTVTLSAANNWRYTWRNLDAADTWRVVEDQVPEGYTVSISRDGATFVVTNTKPDTPPDPTPDPPDPTPDPPDTTPEPPDDDTLARTGILWWPVPLLAASGLVLFLIGWKFLTQKEERDEA